MPFAKVSRIKLLSVSSVKNHSELSSEGCSLAMSIGCGEFVCTALEIQGKRMRENVAHIVP